MAENPRRPAAWLSVLALLALAACTVGGALPAPAESPPPGPAPAAYVEGADGTPLALSHWPAEAPRAVILGVHGFGDYGRSTFAPAAGDWSARGLTVYAYDQRGFGRNVSFGRWPGAEALVADLGAVSAQIRARHPCLPLIVAGHSMGGGVALAAAAERIEADGLVLAAPAIWGGAEMNPAHRMLAWTAAAAVPDRRFSGAGVVTIQATDNIALLRALARDPHYLSPPSAREIYGLVRLADLAARAAERVGLPALLLLGEKDEIVPNDAVRRVFDRLEGPKRVIAYPEGWHLLFRDLQAERVWRDVADWALSDAPVRPSPAGC
ncbi:MAG TPA: alpha/beta fold hydrolase [Thermohalobaculum sp.]|nr:alpha/beta fold hydrolase [Thermohalobaculum sp.]